MIVSFGSHHIYFGKKWVKTGTNKSAINYNTLLLVSIPMLLTNSLYLILNWTDVLMIGYFKSEDFVGIYNISVKIAALNVIGLSSVNAIAAPKFAELYAKKYFCNLRKIVKQTTLIGTIISTPVFLIILIFPQFLLKMFGAGFLDGRIPLLILAGGQFYHAIAGATLILLNMTGYEKTARNIILIGTSLNLVLNYFLIPKYGITGAAIATMTSTIFWKSLSLFYVHKYHNFLTFPFKLNVKQK